MHLRARVFAISHWVDRSFMVVVYILEQIFYLFSLFLVECSVLILSDLLF